MNKAIIQLPEPSRADNQKRTAGVKLHKTFIFNSQIIETDYLDGFVYTTPYSLEMELGLQETQSVAEMSAAGQRESFELAEKEVVARPGGPVEVVQSTPSFFATAEGFYDYDNFRYIYQYKDHLGNTRLNFGRDENGVLFTEDSNDYYPFGLNFINPLGGSQQVYNPSTTYKNYKYNGKELQETGMYDYGARFYMPDIGRWGVVDPLAETSRRWSTYTYVYNNPLRFIDPDGRQGTDIFKWDNAGKLTKVQDSNTDVIYAENQFKSDGKTLKEDAKGVEVGEKGYVEANKQEISLSETYTDRQGESSNTLTTLSFHNNTEKATEVAEYMYNNGASEFSNSTYASDKGGFSVVSTLGLPSQTLVDPKQFMKNFNINGDSFYPSTFTNHDHNHPSNTLPSGYMLNVKDGVYIPRRSDVEGARGNTDYHNTVNPDFKNVKFRTYLKGKYMNYNSKNAYYD